MHDIVEVLGSWYGEGIPFALARVITTFPASPRPPGSALAVNARGAVVGDVSGDTATEAIRVIAEQVLATGRTALRELVVADRAASAAGLTCGGTLRAFIEPVDPQHWPEFTGVLAAMRERRPLAVATVLDTGVEVARHLLIEAERTTGTLGSPELDRSVAKQGREHLLRGTTALSSAGSDATEVFLQSLVPAPRLLIFGAVDLAREVAALGDFLGYRVSVCDARPGFATTQRFPQAVEVVERMPHEFFSATSLDERTAVCVFTHDLSYDVPLLRAALRTSVPYIGVMGSRHTHAERVAALRDAGVSAQQLSRLRAPIGLDLGGRSPRETALSILGEVLAARTGSSGRPLVELTEAIHR
ncbi:MAG: XdhC family protein [Sciscionella sp.]